LREQQQEEKKKNSRRSNNYTFKEERHWVTEWQSNNKIPNEASATIVVVVLHFTYIRLKNGQNFLLLKKEKRERKKNEGKSCF
jgi:hypothetical protein